MFEPLEVRRLLSLTPGIEHCPPVLTLIENQQVTVGNELELFFSATDPDTPPTDIGYLLDPNETPAGAQLDYDSGRFTWTPNSTGLYRFAVAVVDSGNPPLADAQIFFVNVTTSGANLPPMISLPPAPGMLEDDVLALEGAGAIMLGDPDAGSDPIEATLSASSGALSLGSAAGLQFTAGDGAADAIFTARGSLTAWNTALNTLSFTPAPNFNGLATLSIEVDDLGRSGTGGAQTATADLAINVTTVNDAPRFIKGGNVSAPGNGQRYSEPWATSVSAGPADESLQTLSFITAISPDQQALFSEAPSITPDGRLIFTPVDGAEGSVTVTARLMDSAGTTNGGEDTSPEESFTISLTPVVPKQVVMLVPSEQSVGPEDPVALQLDYSVSTGDKTLYTLAFRLHFDSSKLAFQGLAGLFQRGLSVEQGPLDETPLHSDGDPSTDKYLLFQWLSSPNVDEFPGEDQTLPLALLTANFQARPGFSGATDVRVVGVDWAVGYEFVGSVAQVGVGAMSVPASKAPAAAEQETTKRTSDSNLDIGCDLSYLDVDGDGVVRSATDGRIISRYLVGTSGPDLVANALGAGATRDTGELVAAFLASSDFLDVDANATPRSATDGRLISRYMVGTVGNALTVGALDNNATRTSADEIRSFLDTFNPLLGPLASLDLVNDSGTSSLDRLTNEPTSQVCLVAYAGFDRLRAGLDGTPVDQWADISDRLTMAGNQGVATLDLTALDQLAGGTLADGNRTIRIEARDDLGRTRILSLPISLDRVAPQAVVGPTGIYRTATRELPVEFSEAMGASTFATDGYLLNPIGESSLPLTGVLRNDSHTLARVRVDAPLTDQTFRLTVRPELTDLAGNSLTGNRTFEFSVVDPVGILEFSPADGETLVATTRETVVRFDDLIDPATITPDAFYVLANGQPVSAKLVKSATNRFATLFFDEPLAAATQLRVHVDGRQIKGADGLLLDADGDDLPGGMRTSDFRTLPADQSLIPGTAVKGRIYDSYNRGPSDTDLPIAGVKISLDSNPSIFTVTDANGEFTLTSPAGLPAPEFFVHIDGSTATTVPPGAPAGSKYATLGKPFHSVPGQVTELNMNGVPFNIYLPPMAMTGDNLTPVVVHQPTNVRIGSYGEELLIRMFGAEEAAAIREQLQVTIPADAAKDFGKNGNPAATLAAVIPVEPDRLPAPLPSGMTPKLVISVQAGTSQGFNLSGENLSFDSPAPIAFPNVDGFAPGDQVSLWSFDHDAGRWTVVDTTTVVAGQPLLFPNGVRAPGWHTVDDTATVTGQLRNAWQDNLAQARAANVAASADFMRSFLPTLLTGMPGRIAQAVGNAIDKFNTFDAFIDISELEGSESAYEPEGFFEIDDRLDYIIGKGLERVEEILDRRDTLRQDTDLFRNSGAELGFAWDFLGVLNDGWKAIEAGRAFDQAVADAMKHNQEHAAQIRQAAAATEAALNSADKAVRDGEQQFSDHFGALADLFDEVARIVDDGTGGVLDWHAESDREEIDDRLGRGTSGAIGSSIEFEIPDPQILPVNSAIRDDKRARGRPVIDLLPPARVADVPDTFADAWTLAVDRNNGVAIDQEIGDNLLFEADDVDMYRVDMTAGEDLSIDVFPMQPSLERAVVRLFGTNREPLAVSATSGIGGRPQVRHWQVAESGTYYVGVSSWNNVTYDPAVSGSGANALYRGDYRLVVTRRDAPPSLELLLDEAIYRFNQASANAQQGYLGDSGAGAGKAFERALELYETEFVPLASMSPMRPSPLVFLSEDGVAIRLLSLADGSFSFRTRANTSYTLVTHDLVKNLSSMSRVRAGAPGSINDLRIIIPGDSRGYSDSDDDGIHDLAEEYLYSTSPGMDDTDGDGESDLAELLAGSDPTNSNPFPRGIIASLPLLGSTTEVVLAGSTSESAVQTAFVATGDYGLAIVDTSEFNNPIVLGQLDLDGTAVDVAVNRTARTAVIAAGNRGVHFVDVSDPLLPQIMRTIPSSTATPQFPVAQVEVIDDVAYLASDGRIVALDVATGEQLGSLSVSASPVRWLAHEGRFLYALDDGAELRIIDTGAGLAMNLLGSTPTPTEESGARAKGRLFVADEIVYVAGVPGYFPGGYATIDVSDKENPVPISESDVPRGPTPIPFLVAPGQAVALTGAGLGVLIGTPSQSSQHILRVLRTGDPSNTYDPLLEFDVELPASPQAVALAAGIAYVADGNRGLQVINYREFDRDRQPPVIDQCLPPDLTSVIEGSIVQIPLVARDDVQIRNVELLVDGQTITNDVTYPWDLSFQSPQRTIDKTNVTVEVRITDTGGNTTTCSQSLELMEDSTAPTIVITDPKPTSEVPTGLRLIRIEFSEPVDPATVTSDSVRLRNVSASGTPLVAQSMPPQMLGGGRVAYLRFADPGLAAGRYQIEISPPGALVTDLAGNPVPEGTILAPFTVVQETIRWTGAAGNDRWNVAGNWSLNRVPEDGDIVAIGDETTIEVRLEQDALPGTPDPDAGIKLLSRGPILVNARLYLNRSSYLGPTRIRFGTILAQDNQTTVRFCGATEFASSTLDGPGEFIAEDVFNTDIINTQVPNRIGSMFLNRGTVVMNEGVFLSPSAILTNEGTWRMLHGGLGAEAPPTARFVQSGTLVHEDSATNRISTLFEAATDSLTLVRSGHLELYLGANLAGTIEIRAAAELRLLGGAIALAGAVKGSGQISFGSTASGPTPLNAVITADYPFSGTSVHLSGNVTIDQPTEFHGPWRLQSSQSFVANASLTFQADAFLDWQAGTLGGTSNITTRGGGRITNGVKLTTKLTVGATPDLPIDMEWASGNITLEGNGLLENQGQFAITPGNSSGLVLSGVVDAMVRRFRNLPAARLLKQGGAQNRFTVPIDNEGEIHIKGGKLEFAGGYTQQSGLLDLWGGEAVTADTLLLTGGELVADSGAIIRANVVNHGAIIRPGRDRTPGTLSIGLNAAARNYTQELNGTLAIDLVNNGSFDQLFVFGTATLVGTVATQFVDGFVPGNGVPFTVIDVAGTRVGTPSVTPTSFPQPGGGSSRFAGTTSGDLVLTVEAVPSAGEGPSPLLIFPSWPVLEYWSPREMLRSREESVSGPGHAFAIASSKAVMPVAAGSTPSREHTFSVYDSSFGRCLDHANRAEFSSTLATPATNNHGNPLAHANNGVAWWLSRSATPIRLPASRGPASRSDARLVDTVLADLDERWYGWLED